MIYIDISWDIDIHFFDYNRCNFWWFVWGNSLGPLHSGLDWGWWTHMNYPHVVLFFVGAMGRKGRPTSYPWLECKQSLRTYWTSTCFLPLLVNQSPKLEYLISVPVMSINPIIRVGICTFISSGQGWWIPSRDLAYPTKQEKEHHWLTSILGGIMLVPSEGLTAS